jgi:uncharacterized membrane protein YfcA
VLSLPVLAWVALAVGALLTGVNTIAVALFAAVLPARQSTGVLLVLLMVGDLFAIWSYRRHADWQVLRRLVPTVVLGLLVGTAFLAVTGDAAVRRVIGAILLALLALTVARRGVARRPGTAQRPDAAPTPAWRRRTASGTYGVLAGFTTMVANAGGPVMSMYFLASRLPVVTFLGTAAWFFFAVNLTKVPFSLGLGLITPGSLLVDVALLPAVVAGALLGRRVVRHISQAVFDRLVVVLTAVAAVYLLVG